MRGKNKVYNETINLKGNKMFKKFPDAKYYLAAAAIVTTAIVAVGMIAADIKDCVDNSENN